MSRGEPEILAPGRSRLQPPKSGRWGVARLTAAEFVIHMRTVTDSDAGELSIAPPTSIVSSAPSASPPSSSAARFMPSRCCFSSWGYGRALHPHGQSSALRTTKTGPEARERRLGGLVCVLPRRAVFTSSTRRNSYGRGTNTDFPPRLPADMPVGAT